ncbi:phosphatases II [Trametes versicolor FP-101664 SS1]|uniref:phosphatases II n=1 Tax=Trametes versicolor (strain FP-101664) TaxID=717944 RepID=UPI000462313C|nr:phosphatases II [Trametes versicolor FP-101664 SS1]EIW58502.1 phosphatases II [Trametes versicolor FP-101664 SS1]
MIREAAQTPSEITSRLYLSGLYTAVDEEQLIAIGVTHVVSVIEHRPKYPKTLTKLKTLHIPVEDSEYADLLQHLEVTSAFIKSALEDRRNIVLVHCAMGISRSPTVVCAYLVAHRGMSPHQALEYVVSRRAIVHRNAGFLRQLNIFANRLRGSKKLRRPGLPPPPPPVRVTVTRSMTEVERYGAGWGRPGPQSQPHSHSRDGRPPPPGQMMTRRGSMGP